MGARWLNIAPGSCCHSNTKPSGSSPAQQNIALEPWQGLRRVGGSIRADPSSPLPRAESSRLALDIGSADCIPVFRAALGHADCAIVAKLEIGDAPRYTSRNHKNESITWAFSEQCSGRAIGHQTGASTFDPERLFEDLVALG
jgi:hypothetical protein